MKTLSLNVGERQAILQLCDLKKGGFVEINKIFKLINLVQLTDKEVKLVDYKIIKNEQGQVVGSQWSNPKYEAEIEFSEELFNLVKEILEIKDKMANWDIKDPLTYSAVSLNDKIIALEEAENEAGKAKK